MAHTALRRPHQVEQRILFAVDTNLDQVEVVASTNVHDRTTGQRSVTDMAASSEATARSDVRSKPFDPKFVPGGRPKCRDLRFSGLGKRFIVDVRDDEHLFGVCVLDTARDDRALRRSDRRELLIVHCVASGRRA